MWSIRKGSWPMRYSRNWSTTASAASGKPHAPDWPIPVSPESVVIRTTKLVPIRSLPMRSPSTFSIFMRQALWLGSAPGRWAGRSVSETILARVGWPVSEGRTSPIGGSQRPRPDPPNDQPRPNAPVGGGRRALRRRTRRPRRGRHPCAHPAGALARRLAVGRTGGAASGRGGPRRTVRAGRRRSRRGRRPAGRRAPPRSR